MWRSDDPWQAACANPPQSLHVVGVDDHQHHDADRHSKIAGETVEIPATDHRLEVAGDIFATLDAWRTMADAVVRFADRRA